LCSDAGSGAEEIDEVEEILLAELEESDAVDAGGTEVEAFAIADDAAENCAGICARDCVGEPATERRVGCVDDAVVARQAQSGEKFVRVGRNFAVGKTEGDGVVERFEGVGECDDVGDCGAAEQHFVR
jgi:hypothetical protein